MSLHRSRSNSNSSQETAAGRQKKRSFSPVSDDDTIKDIARFPANDDSDTPDTAPLLRQAVGFSSIVTTEPSPFVGASLIPTYQANISTPTAFLPGQSTSTSVPPATATTVTKPKKKPRTRKKPVVVDTSNVPTIATSSFGRFRLETYNPTGPVAVPGTEAKQPGPGPYSSLYRASPYPPRKNKSTPSPTLTSGVSDVSQLSTVPPKAVSTVAKGKRPVPAPSQAQTPEPSSTSSSKHYRRDYDREHPLGADRDGPREGSIDGIQSEDMMSDGHPVKRSSRHQLRMVTLLIQDTRGAQTDHQLAEVYVQLRATDDPRDGFWADAKDICQRLQSSPSRIDGPAKVYTLRGKYRQFILRVSADNADETQSSNVIVSADRTLQVVVELLQSGYAPPHLPRPIRSPTPEDIIDRAVRDLNHRTAAEQQPSRKRPHSPPLPSMNAVNSPTKIQRTTATRREMYQAPLGADSPEWDYESPSSDEESEPLHDRIVKRVDPLLQEHAGWTAYYESAGRPPTVSNVLTQYRFVQDLIDRYVGQRVPFIPSCLIEKPHILGALGIEDERFAADCEDTLKLLNLYGPEGIRLQDQRVIEMMTDNTLPIANAKPIKRFLRLLKEIDASWHQRNASRTHGREQ